MGVIGTDTAPPKLKSALGRVRRNTARSTQPASKNPETHIAQDGKDRAAKLQPPAASQAPKKTAVGNNKARSSFNISSRTAAPVLLPCPELKSRVGPEFVAQHSKELFGVLVDFGRFASADFCVVSGITLGVKIAD